MEQYLMAVDAGTGSVRAVIFGLKGNQIGVAQEEWTHKEDPRFPGSMDFDVETNWKLTCSCIQKVLSETAIPAEAIAAISTTSMREGIVLYDKCGQEIWACANVDARSGAEVIELAAKSPTLEREIYRISGQTYALGALPRILWVKNHLPEVYEKTATVNMFNDWLIYKLTDVLCAEPSNGCTTGIFSLEKRTWQKEIAGRCDLREDIFPPVYESGSIVGVVTAACAAATGLKEGTPVVAGGGDAQLGAVGVGVVQPGQAAVFGGSFWQYEFNTDEAKTDSDYRVRVNCHAVPGIWEYEAIAFYPGLVMRWYRDAFCQAEKAEGARKKVDPYTLMEPEAAKIPAGCYGMMCSFSDVMNYIAWRHAAPTFTNFGLDAAKFNRFTFYRAIMENAALVTRGHMDLVTEVTGRKPTEIVFANGASKSPLWCQIMADVLKVTVKVPVVKESTALGAAMCAGIGVGLYRDLPSAAAKIVKWDKEFQPIVENIKTYDDLYPRWRKVYAAQLNLADQHQTTYMWAAPGF